MSVAGLQPRDPGQGAWTSWVSPAPVVPPETQGWTTTSSWTAWTSSWTTSWTTSCTTTTPITTITEAPCPCDETTTSIVPVQTTTTTGSPATADVYEHQHHSGLSPGAVGGIVIGVFFGILLLALLCICCFRNWRRPYYYESDTSSTSSRPRRPVGIDPYPTRPGANLTFVGGGNQPETRVVVTRREKVFIRPPPRAVRTTTRIKDRVVVVEED